MVDHTDPTAARHSQPLLPDAMWPMSGTYAGLGDDYRVEVRLDLDIGHVDAMLTVEFYARDGGVGTHIGAAELRSSSIVDLSDHILIRGVARFTFAAAAPLMEVHIERRNVLQRRSPLRLQFLAMPLLPGALYICEYRSHAALIGASDAGPIDTVVPLQRRLRQS